MASRSSRTPTRERPERSERNAARSYIPFDLVSISRQLRDFPAIPEIRGGEKVDGRVIAARKAAPSQLSGGGERRSIIMCPEHDKTLTTNEQKRNPWTGERKVSAG